MAEEKTTVEDIDRSLYDFKDSEEGFYKVNEGLTPEIVEQISKEKNDPDWMRQFRLESLEVYNSLKVPDWGPDITDLNMDDIVTYVAQSGEMKGLLITHRVVKAPYQQGDEYYVVTKGDANDAEDDPVNVSQIQGKMLFKIGILKYLFDFFVTPWGLLAIIALIILAFSNEIVIFVKSIFGIGFEEKTNVEEIIERYQKENMKKLREEAEEAKKSEKSDEPADNTEGGAE